MSNDIQDVRALLAPANPCPPGSLAGSGHDDIGRAAFARVTGKVASNTASASTTGAGRGLRSRTRHGLTPRARRGSGPRPARRPGRRGVVRLVAVGGLAVALATGVTVAQNLGGTDGNGRPRPILPGLPAGPVANAQEALHKAADAAQHRPFTPPRPGQWEFLKTRYRRIDKPGDGEVRTPRSRRKTEIDQYWTRVDGKKMALFENGRLVITNTGGGMPPSDYAGLAALPRDPDALLAYVRAQMPRGDRDAFAFALLQSILGNSVLPPEQEAATYRAIAKIPGVELNKRAVDVQGRPALAVTLVSEGWSKDEILLDAVTYAYRGHRSTAIKDHTFDMPKWTIKKGTIESESVRLAAGFVDRPGQRLPGVPVP